MGKADLERRILHDRAAWWPYYVNDFMMNFLYTTGFPHFILPPRGGETVGRGGSGKILQLRDRREADTVNHFWTWFEMGPSHTDTQRSLAQINRIHAGIWKKMPGNFSHIDDFVYTMCWIGADLHRLRRRIGLPGFTRNQQIASHRFWYEISKMFVSEVGPVDHEFPANFDGMLEYLARYEAVDWEYSPEGGQTCEALLQQFSRRWFPKGFHWAGRAMILSLLDEPARRVHRLPRPHPLVVRLNEWGMRLMLLTKGRSSPDPKISTPERHRLRAVNPASR